MDGGASDNYVMDDILAVGLEQCDLGVIFYSSYRQSTRPVHTDGASPSMVPLEETIKYSSQATLFMFS